MISWHIVLSLILYWSIVQPKKRIYGSSLKLIVVRIYQIVTGLTNMSS